jgi:hypothetical protein
VYPVKGGERRIGRDNLVPPGQILCVTRTKPVIQNEFG